jgi:mannitol/fructose-specific phosphotransferase system IIA component (Ntr-type)
MPILFTSGIVVMGLCWYHFHARGKVKREGAIFHWFALLGKQQYNELENELMTILKEKGLREGDPFDETVIKSKIKILQTPTDLKEILDKVSDNFVAELAIQKEDITNMFSHSLPDESVIALPGVLVFHAKCKNVVHPSLQIVFSKKAIGLTKPFNGRKVKTPLYVCVFLVNSDENPKQQLRMLSRLLDILERDDIVKALLKMKSHREIKEYMLQNERFVSIKLLKGTPQENMIGRQLKDIELPKDVLVALVERKKITFTPNGSTTLLVDDVLTILGETKSISKLYNEYMGYEIAKLDT